MPMMSANIPAIANRLGFRNAENPPIILVNIRLVDVADGSPQE